MSARVVGYDRDTHGKYHFVTFNSNHTSHHIARDRIFGANANISMKTIEKMGRVIEFFCKDRQPLGLIAYSKKSESSSFLRVYSMLLINPVDGMILGHRVRMFASIPELAKKRGVEGVQIVVSPADLSMREFLEKNGYQKGHEQNADCFFRSVDAKTSSKRVDREAEPEVVAQKAKLQRANALTRRDIEQYYMQRFAAYAEKISTIESGASTSDGSGPSILRASTNIDNKEQQSKERDA